MKRKIVFLITLVLMGIGTNGMAQTLKGLVNSSDVSKVVSSVVDHIKGLDLVGIWSYNGAAIEFESDNLLKKATGTVASSTIEKKLNDQLTNLGFKQGVTTYTFNEDGTFTSLINNHSAKGTYVYDTETGYLTLKYMHLVGVKAKLSGNSNKICLLFEADKFLTLLSALGGLSDITAIKAIGTLAGSYDGMLIGFELKKQ